MSATPSDNLISCAHSALISCDLEQKVDLARKSTRAWLERRLSFKGSRSPVPPDRPGRPDRPKLVSPTTVSPRSVGTLEGRISLIHAIAHIELNAIDLALDIIVRFHQHRMPRSFFDGWARVASEEAKHFTLLQNRLLSLGATYGDLPAHDGLWEAAGETGHDLTARLAIVPLVLEARGLDVTPPIIRKLESVGDHETADIFRVIYEDEKGHVAVGAKWFRFLCHRERRNPARTFAELVNLHFRGRLKPPFNDRARAANGLTPLFYRALSTAGN